MIDYSKLADELRAKRIAADAAADPKQREEQTLKAFFKSVEARSAQEINTANPELRNRGLLNGDYQAGITMSRDEGQDLIRFRFGPTRQCTLALYASRCRMEATLLANSRDVYSREQTMIFTMTFLGLQLKVFRESSGTYPIKPTVEVQAQDIAEALIAGMIRGTFD